jgi:hypothetical protein
VWLCEQVYSSLRHPNPPVHEREAAAPCAEQRVRNGEVTGAAIARVVNTGVAAVVVATALAVAVAVAVANRIGVVEFKLRGCAHTCTRAGTRTRTRRTHTRTGAGTRTHTRTRTYSHTCIHTRTQATVNDTKMRAACEQQQRRVPSSLCRWRVAHASDFHANIAATLIRHIRFFLVFLPRLLSPLYIAAVATNFL